MFATVRTTKPEVAEVRSDEESAGSNCDETFPAFSNQIMKYHSSKGDADQTNGS
jgi:hypothetical protein